MDTFSNFNLVEDTLQFSKTAFSDILLPASGAIASGQFFAGAELTGAGNEGTADTRFLYDTANGNLFYDADGSASGVAVQIAVLNSDDQGHQSSGADRK